MYLHIYPCIAFKVQQSNAMIKHKIRYILPNFMHYIYSIDITEISNNHLILSLKIEIIYATFNNFENYEYFQYSYQE